MTTTTPPPPKTTPAEVNVFAFRKTARSRAWICPGAGFDFMGRPINAVVCYLSSIGAFACGIATALMPSQALLFTTIGLIVFGTVLWLFEIFSTFTAWPTAEIKHPRFNPWIGMFGIWIVVTMFGLIVLSSYQLAECQGPEMAPTIADKESFLFHKQVDERRLKRGAVVMFGLDAANKIEEPGKLTIGRIIALPGETMTINKTGHYVINGEVGPHMSSAGTLPLAIRVPTAPGKVEVPANCYFIAQDSPEHGYDTRVIGYAKRDQIISTQMFRFEKSPFLRTIE